MPFLHVFQARSVVQLLSRRGGGLRNIPYCPQFQSVYRVSVHADKDGLPSCSDRARRFSGAHGQPAASGVLLRALADNLQKALAKSANSCLATAPVRVCRLLAASMAEESPHEIPGYLTHAEIAGHLSLHVMTVTKIFHALREQGILAKQGRAVMVRETGRLLQIANQEKILLY